jgi:hypothetical protein
MTDRTSGCRKPDGDLGNTFGFWPRDQHTCINGEVKVPKPPTAQYVLDRLTAPGSRHHCIEVTHRSFGGGLIEHRCELSGRR